VSHPEGHHFLYICALADGGNDDENNDSWGEADDNDLNDVITLATLPAGTSNTEFLIASGE